VVAEAAVWGDTVAYSSSSGKAAPELAVTELQPSRPLLVGQIGERSCRGSPRAQVSGVGDERATYEGLLALP
jgi:hypothetical protein